MGRLKYYYCQICDDYSTIPNFCDHERVFVFSEKMRRNLSKFLSYIFRHNPRQIGIELDSNGFSQIPVDQLIPLIQKARNSDWITLETLKALIVLDHKGRFEIKNNRFRARYGHSLKYIKIEKRISDLPEILYHGTNMAAYELIKIEGLKPMGRNLVHLTSSIKDARIVGRRHKGDLVLLEINVRGALQDEIEIWQAGKSIYVSNYIPPQYIRVFPEAN
ncbi:MAG: RNA 2'-phosphotransferase [Candidatus Helarchaeota archaeon]